MGRIRSAGGAWLTVGPQGVCAISEQGSTCEPHPQEARSQDKSLVFGGPGSLMHGEQEFSLRGRAGRPQGRNDIPQRSPQKGPTLLPPPCPPTLTSPNSPVQPSPPCIPPTPARSEVRPTHSRLQAANIHGHFLECPVLLHHHPPAEPASALPRESGFICFDAQGPRCLASACTSVLRGHLYEVVYCLNVRERVAVPHPEWQEMG